MELWDLYDADRRPTGETHIRGEKIPADRFHLVVHVWIVNQKGEYLISQRAASRPTLPLMWESVGGSVLAGETSIQGAVREAKEEVGIDLAPETGRLLRSETRRVIDGKPFQDILDIWRFPYDGTVDLQNATTGEVAQTKWLTAAQVEALLQSGKMVGTLSYFKAVVAP